MQRLSLILLLATFVVVIGTTRAAEATDDGLVPIKMKNIDRAYKHPDASLKGYSKILFKPVSVAFSKHWEPRNYGTFGLKPKEIETIRTSLAKIAADEFRTALSEGGYPLVESAGEGVLELEAQIVDLYINAPAEPAVGTRTYVMSAGEMRLVMTLRDSVTGTTLYRAIDKKRGPDTGRLEWVTPAWNRAEAARLLGGWAKQLKAALDAARSD
jgi:hypothetical protein